MRTKISNLHTYPKDSILGIAYSNGIDVYKDSVNFTFVRHTEEITIHRFLNYETVKIKLKEAFKIDEL